MNRNLLASWMGCAALLGIAGCERPDAPETFPQAAADGWVAAFNSGDIDGLALMYSPDAEILPPDNPIVTGHEASVGYWQNYNPGQVRLEISESETFAAGDYWLREGSYSAMYPVEGEPRVGKFMELWKKVDGAWVLHRHMWSPNAPQPAQMPELAPAS